MENKLPQGWTEDKITNVIDHYESQTEDEAISEDETVLAIEKTLIQVPLNMVADVRAFIARQQAEQ